jgi:hypothetical protein
MAIRASSTTTSQTPQESLKDEWRLCVTMRKLSLAHVPADLAKRYPGGERTAVTARIGTSEN